MKKVILTILDGYGLSDQKEGNAVLLAKTKTLNKIFQEYPFSKLKASGLDVGLPSGQMGNSEVGHTNIGAGRIIYQDLTKINRDIENGQFFQKDKLIQAISYAKTNHQKLHLLGLLSDGGVHSHIKHLYAILDLAVKLQFKDIYVHAFLDGRDTSPTSGLTYLKALTTKLQSLGLPRIGTVIGRYYAMDRDKRYDRIEKAYRLLVEGQGEVTTDLFKTIENKYQNELTDEFMEPIIYNEKALIEPKDAVIFFNFRPDRAREITRSLNDLTFPYFKRPNLDLNYTCMTEYDATIKNVNIIYPPEEIKNTLGEVVAKQGLKQLRIAETEKYAHVTFFLNGGSETEFKGEDRILIPSPKEVKTYDLKPEMSAYVVTSKVLEALDKDYYDLIVLNFANPDMVGHTGNLEACIKAIEAIDSCMEKILAKVLAKDYVMLVTADHGNAECMINNDGSINTAHTTNLVPLALVNYEVKSLNDGRLSDISPTILEILGLPKPLEMTGNSLINK